MLSLCTNIARFKCYWKIVSDRLKPYVSCLSSASTHSYSDRVHSSNAPVAAHEAGEAQPSGSLLSGGSGEQQSKRPARYSNPQAPAQHRGSATAHPVRHPSIAGSIRERARRTGVEDGQQKDLASPQPLASSAVSSRRREGVRKKNPTPATYPCLLLQPAYMVLKSDQTSQTTQICDESC